jgi:hypothetical protein
MDCNAEKNGYTKAVLAECRLDELLAGLGCTGLSRSPGEDAYLGPCPVHEGRHNHFRLHIDSEDMTIGWQCESYKCEQEYGASLLGLIRGVLSVQAGEVVPPEAALNWLRQFLGEPTGPAWTREQIRRRLQIPSPYFVGRGFSPDVLDQADVGYSPKLKRHVVPVYDDRGTMCIGCTSRSPYEKCPVQSCGLFHRPGRPCPAKSHRWRFQKWLNSKGLPRASCLYNYAAASRFDKDFVFLVEGPTDVWRLSEVGVPAVAVLGSYLTRNQAEKLAGLRRRTFIAFNDNQDPRKRAERAIRLLSSPSVFVPLPETFHYVGDMSAGDAERWVRALTC